MIALKDHLDRNAWKAALELFPAECRDVNFLPEFFDIQVSDGRGEAVCTLLSEGDKHLFIPGLRHAVPSELSTKTPGRFYDIQSSMGFGGVLATPNVDADFIERAWAEWKKVRAADGTVAAFFRLHPVVERREWYSADTKHRAFRKLAYTPLTQGLEYVWTKVDPAHRRQVKKAQRADVQVLWDEPRAWDEFEGFYNEVMKKKNAWADAFVSHEHHVLLRKMPGASLACVRENGELAAAIVFIFGPKCVHYHMSVRTETSPVYAHNIIVQTAIERAHAKGCDGVLIGGGITTAIDDPLLVFKRRAGFELLDYNIALVTANDTVYRELHEDWMAKAGSEPGWLMTYRQPLPKKET